MSRRHPPQISSRKEPQQARSTELVAAILQAALQVLAQDGVTRFTVARVADRAGVSVGSIYQYFPNKAAILFRLQSDEWAQTTQMLRNILEDVSRPPLERLRALVHAFVRSECEEAQLRMALHDAAPLYRDALEAKEINDQWDGIFATFMKEALPAASGESRTQACDLISTTLSAVAKDYSGRSCSPEEMKHNADALADMFCAYITELASH